MGDNSDWSAIFQVQIGYVVPTIIGITHEWEITQTGQLYLGSNRVCCTFHHRNNS